MTLQHLIEEAHAVGVKTGQASKQKDESRARFHKDWFVRFKGLHWEDRRQLEEAFNNGYRAGYGPVRVEPFR